MVGVCAMQNKDEYIEELRQVWGDWKRPPGASGPVGSDWAGNVDWSSVPAEEQSALVARLSAAGVDDRNRRAFDFVCLGLDAFGAGEHLKSNSVVYPVHNGAPLDCSSFDHKGQYVVLINDGVHDLSQHLAFFFSLCHRDPEDPGYQSIDLKSEQDLWRRVLLVEGQSLIHSGSLWQPVRIKGEGPEQIFAQVMAEYCTAFAIAHELAHGLLRLWSEPTRRTYQGKEFLLPEGWDVPGHTLEVLCDRMAVLMLIEAASSLELKKWDEADTFYYPHFLAPGLMTFFWTLMFVEDQMFIKRSSSHPLSQVRMKYCLEMLSDTYHEKVVQEFFPSFTNMSTLGIPQYRPQEIDIVKSVSESEMCNLSPLFNEADINYLCYMNISAEIYDTSADFLYFVTCVGDHKDEKMTQEWMQGIEIPDGSSEAVLSYMGSRVNCGRNLLWGILMATAANDASLMLNPRPGTFSGAWLEELCNIFPAAENLVTERILWAAVRGREPGYWNEPEQPIITIPKYISHN